jgi:hypothetical protein
LARPKNLVTTRTDINNETETVS